MKQGQCQKTVKGLAMSKQNKLGKAKDESQKNSQRIKNQDIQHNTKGLEKSDALGQTVQLLCRLSLNKSLVYVHVRLGRNVCDQSG